MLTAMIQTPESSQIAAYGYDAASRTLRVQFRDREKKPAAVAYDYQDVPPEIHAGLNGAASKGSFIHSTIVRPKAFAFQKVDVDVADAEPAQA